MRQSGFRAWKVFGGLAAVALLGAGCGALPYTGGERPDDPPLTFLRTQKEGVSYDKFHYPDRGYNGTIQQLGSSIDPRTPETGGTVGNSRLVDGTGRPAPGEPELGIGGSGDAGQVGDPDGSIDRGWRARRGYDVGLGDTGSFIAPPGSGQIPGP